MTGEYREGRLGSKRGRTLRTKVEPLSAGLDP